MESETPRLPTPVPWDHEDIVFGDTFEGTSGRHQSLRNAMTRRECQCCYLEFGELGMTHCQNDSPHWFCLTCVKRYANEVLGHGQTVLKCLDQSDCSARFSEKEIRRVLGAKAYQALERLRTEIAIREANIEGLVHCPFCDFAAIMEDPTDRIFECQNCLQLSCRYCRVKSHHPMTCEQYQTAKLGDARHTVEEAMTAAFLRNCNGCKKPFVKEGGCNRMYCSSCPNSQCFICSISVTDYSHFSDSGLCPLYDDDDARLNAAVMQAQGQAITETLKSRDDVHIDGLTVDKNLLPPSFVGVPPVTPVATKRAAILDFMLPDRNDYVEAELAPDDDLDLNHDLDIHNIEEPRKSYMINPMLLRPNEWHFGGRAPGTGPVLKELYYHGRYFELSKRMYGTWVLWDPEGLWDWPERYWWRDWDEKTDALKQDAKRAIKNCYNPILEKMGWEELLKDRRDWVKGLKRPRTKLLKKIGKAVKVLKGIKGNAQKD